MMSTITTQRRGGSTPRPGEVTLASRGVLYLDEIAEFARAALEM
jgi:magnesium chelatase family protein